VVNLSQQRLASFDREAKNIIELEELDSPTILLKSRLDLSESSLDGSDLVFDIARNGMSVSELADGIIYCDCCPDDVRRESDRACCDA